MHDRHSPGQDIIDLREVIAERDRIVDAIRGVAEEMDAEADGEYANDLTAKIDRDEFDNLAALAEAVGEDETLVEAAGIDYDDLTTLGAIGRLEDELWTDLDSYADNEPALIHESYFVEYAEQLAEEIGAIDRNAGWPLNRIDWEAAANDLKIDYAEVTYGGHTYYTRNY